MPDVAINVNLASEVLKLWICGQCKAITRREDASDHLDWHERMRSQCRLISR